MGVRVLIVNDDSDLQETVVRLLGRFGYSCLTASSGAEAMRAIETESPDLVVTDLHMPGMDGVAVTQCARAHSPTIPVVLLTAYPLRVGHPQVQEAGATIHLAKPFANRDLVQAVQRALGAHTLKLRTPVP
jgi:two-component system, NtrC family, nitrogen regulation response regulator GlnG